jgi:hypothetical protein
VTGTWLAMTIRVMYNPTVLKVAKIILDPENLLCDVVGCIIKEISIRIGRDFSKGKLSTKC